MGGRGTIKLPEPISKAVKSDRKTLPPLRLHDFIFYFCQWDVCTDPAVTTYHRIIKPSESLSSCDVTATSKSVSVALFSHFFKNCFQKLTLRASSPARCLLFYEPSSKFHELKTITKSSCIKRIWITENCIAVCRTLCHKPGEYISFSCKSQPSSNSKSVWHSAKLNTFLCMSVKQRSKFLFLEFLFTFFKSPSLYTMFPCTFHCMKGFYTHRLQNVCSTGAECHQFSSMTGTEVTEMQSGTWHVICAQNVPKLRQDALRAAHVQTRAVFPCTCEVPWEKEHVMMRRAAWHKFTVVSQEPAASVVRATSALTPQFQMYWIKQR